MCLFVNLNFYKSKKVFLMFNKLTILIFLLSVNFSLSSVLRNYKVTLTQPNGYQFECLLSGDESYNFYHTNDGYVIKQNSDGYYYFAKLSNKDVITSQYVINDINLSNSNSLGLDKWIKPEIKSHSDLNQNNHKEVKKSKLLTTSTGKINNLFIFIKFKDQVQKNLDYNFYNNILNKDSATSFKDYYLQVSRNQLEVQTYFTPAGENNVIMFYEDSKNLNYYRPYNKTTNPDGYQSDMQERYRELDLLTYILAQAGSDETLSQIDFDSDDDGKIDNIVFMVQGGPDGWSSLLWPHRSIYTGEATLFGKKPYDYNLMLTDMMNTNSYGLGTLCHEFFHSLGAPDLYHYNQDGFNSTGSWDLMEMTTNPPQYMSSLLQSQYTNWGVKALEIAEEGEFKIYPNGSSDSTLYILYTNNSETDILTIEYRKRQGRYETSLPGSGLIISRVDNNLWKEGNGNGQLGVGNEIYIYRPDGSGNIGGRISNANLSDKVGRTEIGDLTNPSILLNNGKLGGVEIYNIKEHDTYMTFSVSYYPRTSITEPKNEETISEQKASITWKSHPLAKSYDIQVSKDSTFKTIDFEQSVVTNKYTTTSNLDESTRYFTRVRINYSDGNSDWSNITAFYSAAGGPPLYEPKNNSENNPLYASFNWGVVENLSYYKITIATDANMTNTVHTRSLLTTNSYTLSTFKLDPLTKYFWAIEAKTKNNITRNSKVFSFTTGEDKLSVTNQSNSQDVCDGSDYTLFANSWYNVKSYQWYFNDAIINGATDSTYIIPDFKAENEGTYKCVLSSNDNQTANSNDIELNLLIDPNLDSGLDTLKFKENETATFTINIEEEYINIDDALSFQWLLNDEIISDDDTFEGTQSLELVINNPSLSLIGKKLNLRVITACGDTIYSKDKELALGVIDENGFKHFSIAPNPVDNKMTISINLDNYKNVKISLYGINGNFIANLANETMKQKTLEIPLSNFNISTGTYLIMYEYDQNYYTQKIIKK